MQNVGLGAGSLRSHASVPERHNDAATLREFQKADAAG
jgi:hypothetical protein